MRDVASLAGTGPLSPDTVHHLLADDRRRTLLRCLGEHGPLVLDDLAEEVARAEHDAPLAQVPDDDVVRVHHSLWHSHVPKLSEASVVDYDEDRDLVTLGENAPFVAEFAAADLSVGEEAR